MLSPFRTTATLLTLAALAGPAAAQCSGGASFTMLGNHNPFLAGQPAGASAKSDTAQSEAPFLVPISIQGGDRLRFLNVTGDVWNLPGGGGPGPDGWAGHNFDVAPALGISGYLMPENCLLGVFLDDTTNPGPAPAKQDSHSLNHAEYFPELYQTFFIGDGLRADGVTVQEWVVPQGATRLFLGSADGWNWADNSGTFTMDVVKAVPLYACPVTVSLAQGGTQTFDLEAGAANAGRPYLLLGSLSGTTPGIPVDAELLPLSVDPYFLYTLGNVNAPPLSNSFGALDAFGKAQATITVPQGSNPAFAGVVAHHAYLVFDTTSAPAPFVSLASNAVDLTLAP